MEAEPLHAAREKLAGWFKEVSQRAATPETRCTLILSWLRLYRAATDLVVPDFTEENFQRGDASVPPQFPSRYLYGYVQMGARACRNMIRMDLFDAFPFLYVSGEGDRARDEVRWAIGQAGVDEEMCSWLKKPAGSVDVSFPRAGTVIHIPTREERHAWVAGCVARLAAMEQCINPLSMSVPFGGNIPPPLNGTDSNGISACGMASESIVDPDARRQYKAALRENRRLSRASFRYRKAEHAHRLMREQIYDCLYAASRSDPTVREKMFLEAATAGLASDTLSDLHALRLASSVDAALDNFEKTHDLAQVRMARTLLEAMPDHLPKSRLIQPSGPCTLQYLGKFKMEKQLLLLGMLARESGPEAIRICGDLERSIMKEARAKKGASSALYRIARLHGAPESLKRSLKELQDKEMKRCEKKAEALVAACAAGGEDALYDLAEKYVYGYSASIDNHDDGARAKAMRLSLRLLASAKAHGKEIASHLNLSSLSCKYGKSEEECALFLRTAAEFEALKDDLRSLQRRLSARNQRREHKEN